MSRQYNGSHADEVGLGRSPNYEWIKGLLRQCSSQHSDCCESKPLPNIECLIVIDCYSMSLVPLTRDVKSKGYVTLSYVWGSSSQAPDKLSQLADLPALIGDAITVTQKIGYQYVARFPALHPGRGTPRLWAYGSALASATHVHFTAVSLYI